MLQAFRQECGQYQSIRDEALQKLQQRQQHVRAVLEAAACPSEEVDGGRWISSAWLEGWSGSREAPGVIDNSVLLCPHGKLDPSKMTAMKRISMQAWTELQVGGRQPGPTQCWAGSAAAAACMSLLRPEAVPTLCWAASAAAAACMSLLRPEAVLSALGRVCMRTVACRVESRCPLLTVVQ
jgi:hypothetical protein